MATETTRRRMGIVVTTIVGVILIVDAAMPLVAPDMMRAEMMATGWTFGRAHVVSLITLACALLYLLPRTAVLGAILITGFCGGAIATHVRVEDGLTPPMLISLAIGIAAWAGLMLRDPRLRVFLPLVSSSASTRS